MSHFDDCRRLDANEQAGVVERLEYTLRPWGDPAPAEGDGSYTHDVDAVAALLDLAGTIIGDVTRADHLEELRRIVSRFSDTACTLVGPEIGRGSWPDSPRRHVALQ